MEYVLVFITLVALSYLYIKIAEKFKIIDKPNSRSSHTLATIRGGGILFVISVLLFFFLNDFQYPYFVSGVLLISIVSFIDDIITLSSKIRLPFQFLAILLLLIQVGFAFNPVWFFVLLLIIGVGFINIYNFMDGINGLTGMYSVSVLLGLFVVNLDVQILDKDLIIYTLLSLVVFGYYNFRKRARFFAGDVGSISIAMLIFFIGLFLVKETNSPLIILLIVVYGADSILTLAYRKYIGEHITEPHRHHLYQKFVDILKWSHLKVSIIYTAVQVVVNLIIYQTYKLDLKTQFLVFGIIIIVFIMSYIWLFRRMKSKNSVL